MSLPTLWFWLIAILWGGYFLLEGFDFGVGMLLPVLPRTDSEKSMMFESIGPVWDGNEVWLVVAAGATFAAFPAWYATMFSGFYLALLLILVLLILRVVSFEWRERHESRRWRATWLGLNALGSIGAPFLWGIALVNLLHGVPLGSSHQFIGDFLDLFSGYTVLAGVAVVCLFALHGAAYLTVRTTGGFQRRAAAAARILSAPAIVTAMAFLAWTVIVAHNRNSRSVAPVAIVGALTAAALLLAAAAIRVRHEGWAFAFTGLTAIGIVATIFTGLYPRVLVSHPDFANSLTLTNAATGHYALKVITIVAAIFVPLILVYQGWTYYVFRQRLAGEPVTSPLAGSAGPGQAIDSCLHEHSRSTPGASDAVRPSAARGRRGARSDYRARRSGAGDAVRAGGRGVRARNIHEPDLADDRGAGGGLPDARAVRLRDGDRRAARGVGGALRAPNGAGREARAHAGCRRRSSRQCRNRGGGGSGDRGPGAVLRALPAAGHVGLHRAADRDLWCSVCGR